jgi:hypothetical protein
MQRPPVRGVLGSRGANARPFGVDEKSGEPGEQAPGRTGQKQPADADRSPEQPGVPVVNIVGLADWVGFHRG